MAKCTYGYDKNGNVEWRDNYNSFGSDELSRVPISFTPTTQRTG